MNPNDFPYEMDSIFKALKAADDYICRMEAIAQKVKMAFEMMRNQLNDININVTMINIMTTYMIIFPEDFNDQRLFNAFKHLYNPENRTLTLTVEQAEKDIDLLIMIIDAMYQNIQRISEIQFISGKWVPRKKNEGTD